MVLITAQKHYLNIDTFLDIASDILPMYKFTAIDQLLMWILHTKDRGIKNVIWL